MNNQAFLRNFKPEKDFFIGIDSDGCVFDSMEVKQKEFFIPNALKYFELYAISGILRKTWEFVNLYSVYRGGNRFISLVRVLEMLARNPQVIDSGVKLPDVKPLKEWIKNENKLGNETLRKYFESHYDPDLEKVLMWSETVNSEISRWLRKVPPFRNAVRAIEMISCEADLIIVSQTPLEALDREWREHDLKKYVKAIAGQEHGTKKEHLELAAVGKYPADMILMIGDAKGDLDAAVKNEILFYPVVPGKEDESWERFISEGYKRFTSGTFKGAFQDSIVKEFMKALPEEIKDL
jgi:phosphoglycolate phosphatase-like HAD superfamily hydrolase